MTRPKMRIAGTVLSTGDAQALAGFYERLLGWPRRADEPGWVILRAEGAEQALSFHEDVAFAPPVWPSRPGEQLMMAHIDIGTDDMDAAVAHAVACGARVADHQPQ